LTRPDVGERATRLEVRTAAHARALFPALHRSPERGRRLDEWLFGITREEWLAREERR
jgi:hypothetical protein